MYRMFSIGFVCIVIKENCGFTGLAFSVFPRGKTFMLLQCCILERVSKVLLIFLVCLNSVLEYLVYGFS